jgi:hypothetical protein
VQLFAGEEELYNERQNAQEHSEQFLWFKNTLKSLLRNIPSFIPQLLLCK